MKRYSLFFLFGLMPLFVSAQLIINELMSNNISAHFDESWNYSMWVELYNTNTSASYNQQQYFLTDDLSEPKKWRPSSKLIRPNSYSVLFFERPEKTGHATFKLDPEGGSLYLLNSTGVIIDQVQ